MGRSQRVVGNAHDRRLWVQLRTCEGQKSLAGHFPAPLNAAQGTAPDLSWNSAASRMPLLTIICDIRAGSSPRRWAQLRAATVRLHFRPRDTRKEPPLAL